MSQSKCYFHLFSSVAHLHMAQALPFQMSLKKECQYTCAYIKVTLYHFTLFSIAVHCLPIGLYLYCTLFLHWQIKALFSWSYKIHLLDYQSLPPLYRYLFDMLFNTIEIVFIFLRFWQPPRSLLVGLGVLWIWIETKDGILTSSKMLWAMGQ